VDATRAAVEEGVVPGGGVAYIRCLSTLDALAKETEDPQAVGVNIVKKAIEAPLRTIVSNAGHEASVVVNDVKKAKGSTGFNAANEEIEDLVKAGVIDPTKVTRSALQNAASVAGLMLTTEAVIAEKPDEGGADAGPPMGGMPGGMPGMM